MFPVSYDSPVFRPPSEANSLLIQVSLGCSHNKCTFCSMYSTKKFMVRSQKEVFEEIDKLAKFYKSINVNPRRVFLCDGDALCLSFKELMEILNKLNSTFLDLNRIGIYASPKNILIKTSEELQTLATNKLEMAYIGMESGSDEVLKNVNKGNNSQEMIEASLKLMDSGWKISVIAMLGLGGKENTKVHSKKTAEVVSKICPNFFSFLTTVPIPKSIYANEINRGLIHPLTTKELLIEMREIILNIKTSSLKKIIFRANHVSNMFPLAGILDKDQDKLVSVLENWIQECPVNEYPITDPNFL